MSGIRPVMEMVVSCPLPKKFRFASKTFKAALTSYPSLGKPVTDDRGSHGSRGIDQVADRGGSLVPGFTGCADHSDESRRRGVGMKVDVEGHGRFRIGEFHAGGIGEGQVVGRRRWR